MRRLKVRFAAFANERRKADCDRNMSDIQLLPVRIASTGKEARWSNYGATTIRTIFKTEEERPSCFLRRVKTNSTGTLAGLCPHALDPQDTAQRTGKTDNAVVEVHVAKGARRHGQVAEV